MFSGNAFLSLRVLKSVVVDMKAYTVSDKEKLGNVVVYIANHVPDLSKTKLLKLLYFMEEYSVKRFHTPFLGLLFEVWQAGPVVKDVFIDLSETPVLLDGFVKKEVKDGNTYISAIKEFCDDEFSDNDIVVMDDMLKKYGNMTAKQLVNLTHAKGSLWYKVAEQEHLLEAFKEGKLNNSSYEIDFSEELPKCAREFYKEQVDFLKLTREC